MGQGQSLRRQDLPTLDELGGFDRPPIRLCDTVNTQLKWLQEGIQHQYTNAETSLDKNAELNRGIHLAAMGAAPLRPKAVAFGGSTDESKANHEKSVAEKKNMLRLQYAKRPATSRPATARPATIRPVTTRPRLVGFKLSFKQLETEEDEVPRLELSGKSSRSLHSGKSVRSISSVRSKKSIRQRSKPTFDLDSILARLPPSKTLGVLLKEEEGMHWRHRVKRAKMRLYWYLRVYAKWMAVLRRKRRGYAEPLNASSLPNILASKLGTNREQFFAFMQKSLAASELGVLTDEDLEAKEGKTFDDDEDQPYPISKPATPISPFLKATRGFFSPQLSRGSTKDIVTATPAKISLSGSPLSSLANSGSPRASQGRNITPVPPSSPLGTQPFARRGGRVRALSSSGSGSSPNALIPTIRQKPVIAFGRVIKAEPLVIPDTRDAVEFDRRSAPTMPLPSFIVDPGQAEKQVKPSVLKTFGDQLPAQNPYAGMMLYANRANAMWVEGHFSDHAGLKGQAMALPRSLARESSFIKKDSHGWASPSVYDYNKLSARAEMNNYSQYASSIVAEGKIAVQITYLGEEQSLELEEKPDESNNAKSSLELDLWAAIAHLFPHRLPPGVRLNGLTLLDRQIIQTIVNAEKMANKQHAASSLIIVLCVHSAYVDWVAEQVIVKKHWGLPSEHILILSIANLPPLIWDIQKKNVNVSYSTTKHPFQPAGSGYSLLAAGLPGEAFWMDPVSKHRSYLNTSVLNMLSKAKVEYLYSSRLTDYANLNLSSPTLDPAFLAPAIYAMDLQGASVAAEVIQQGSSDALLRKIGIIAMSHVTDRNGTCLISASDLETIQGRALVALANIEPGGMWGGNSRYLFKVDALVKTVTSANVFRWTIAAKAPCAYLSIDVVDLTHRLDFKCVAIAGRSQGPNASAKLVSSEALRDMASVLIVQDNQPSFKRRAMETCIDNDRAHAQSPSTELAWSNDYEHRPPGSCRVLLFAGNNLSSRLGFKLCGSLVKHLGDAVHIVHFVKGSASTLELYDAKAMLDTFADVRLDHLLRRKVVAQQGSLIESMEIEIAKLAPDLVVVGTEGQSSVMDQLRPANWSRGNQDNLLGDNIAISLLKLATLMPLLIVKPDSVGPLSTVKSHDDSPGKARSKIRLMIEAGNTQLPMLHWISKRLTPSRDKFIFVRPYGRKAEGDEKRISERLLATYSNEAKMKGFEDSECFSIVQGRKDGVPATVVLSKPDILCLQAPDSKITPPEIIDLVKSSRTSALIWRPFDNSKI